MPRAAPAAGAARVVTTAAANAASPSSYATEGATGYEHRGTVPPGAAQRQ
ncbi:hypothetical protein ABZ471_17330 [Streptomyces sp. NPDC005728]